MNHNTLRFASLADTTADTDELTPRVTFISISASNHAMLQAQRAVLLARIDATLRANEARLAL